jgi:hypothetical protein
MKNIANRVVLDTRTELAAICPFRLLYSCRSIVALPSPQKILVLKQISLLCARRVFACRFVRSKSVLPWGPVLGVMFVRQE